MYSCSSSKEDLVESYMLDMDPITTSSSRRQSFASDAGAAPAPVITFAADHNQPYQHQQHLHLHGGGNGDEHAHHGHHHHHHHWRPSKRFILAFLSLETIVAAVAIESTSLPSAIPIMSAELGGTALQAFWAGTGYLLASCVVQPTVASMSHILGRRIMLYVSAIGFLGGSLIAALAHNFNVVLVGRIVQGLGGGGLLVLLEILISDLVPLTHRGLWFSINSTMWVIGTALGPLVGAGFAQNLTWRWIFWINFPIVVLGMLLAQLFLKLQPISGDVLAKMARFDWLGSLLFSASSAGFLFGLTTGGVMFEWSSYQTLAPLLVGFLGMCAFVYWEFNFASEPLLERRIFGTWTATATYIQTLLHSLIMWAVLFFLVLYYQGVKSFSAVDSAVALLPETLGNISSIAGGFFIGMTQKYRWALWLGWSLTTVGTGLLYLLEPGTTTVQWVFLNIPFGVGTGILFTAQLVGIQSATEPELNGQAAAFFSFIRVFGSAIGIAVSGVLFQNVFKGKLEAIPELVVSAIDYSRDATVVVELLKEMKDESLKAEVVDAFAESLQALWLCLLALSGVALILSFTVKSYSMNQEHVSNQKLTEKEKTNADNGESVIQSSWSKPRGEKEMS